MCAPVIEKFSQIYNDVLFYKVDVDSQEQIKQDQKISAMPTFKFFKNGIVIGEVIGADMNAVETIIKKHSIPTTEMKELDENQDLAKAIEMSKQSDDMQIVTEEQQEVEKPKAPESKMSAEDALAICEMAVDQEMLKELMGVDIKKLHAVKALLEVQSRSTEAALKWIVDHSDDPKIDDRIEIMDGPPPKMDQEAQKLKVLAGKEETKRLIAKKQQEKADRERKEKIEDEKKRREFGKKAVSTKEDFEKIMADRARADLKREKIADAKRKKELQEAMEKDKERRRLERLGKTQTVEEIPKKVEVKKVEVKKEEPKKEIKKEEPKKVEIKKEEPKKVEEVKKEEVKKPFSDECVIQLRLLDGSSKTVSFKATETIGHVRAHAYMLMNDAKFNIMTNFPKKYFMDPTVTLKDAGLTPRCQLICTKGEL